MDALPAWIGRRALVILDFGSKYLQSSRVEEAITPTVTIISRGSLVCSSPSEAEEDKYEEPKLLRQCRNCQTALLSKAETRDEGWLPAPHLLLPCRMRQLLSLARVELNPLSSHVIAIAFTS